MGHEAFGVDLAALTEAEKSIHDAAAELSGIGGGLGTKAGEYGFGLEGLANNSGEIGHEALGDALGELAKAWSYGLHNMMRDGQAVAAALRDTRAGYEQTEEQATAKLKEVLHAFGGNPYEEDSAWRDKSWSQIHESQRRGT